MSDSTRPTVRDLAESAVGLQGYVVLFRQWSAQANKEGLITVPAAKLQASADFFDRVVGELLDLIPPTKADDAENT